MMIPIQHGRLLLLCSILVPSILQGMLEMDISPPQSVDGKVMLVTTVIANYEGTPQDRRLLNIQTHINEAELLMLQTRPELAALRYDLAYSTYTTLPHQQQNIDSIETFLTKISHCYEVAAYNFFHDKEYDYSSNFLQTGGRYLMTLAQYFPKGESKRSLHNRYARLFFSRALNLVVSCLIGPAKHHQQQLNTFWKSPQFDRYLKLKKQFVEITEWDLYPPDDPDFDYRGSKYHILLARKEDLEALIAQCEQ